jgi:phosphonate metabolism-associated iron-containing alcohol dehydrogenase
MKLDWTFHNPVQIHFGKGCVAKVIAALPYRRMLLVTSAGMSRRGTARWLVESVAGAITEVFDGVLPNPEMAALDAFAVRYRQRGLEAIVALGGGSALDTAKVLSVLLGTPADFTLRTHFLEKRPIPEAPHVPVIAIPTTAGTGSEVTPFATVWDSAATKKYSLADIRMFPRFALVDPELTIDMPWEVRLATGLDALCQALESVWNRNATPLTTGFATRAAGLAWHALQEGEQFGQSAAQRSAMMEASLLAGLAISQTRTALCHSMSYPITARFGLPHGLACAFTMPAVLRYNLGVDDGRLAELARHLQYADAAALADAMAALLRNLQVPRLVSPAIGGLAQLQDLIPEMVTPGRADNNLRPVEPGAIGSILARAVADLWEPTTL